MNKDSIIGCVLGTAVGDALGLPYEGLPRKRQFRLYKDINGYRFFLGRGMVSDDTEHTCMVAEALIEAGGDSSLFARSLARRMRYWLLTLPAGAGLGTLRAVIKLWLGFSPEKSGVFTAGNGPAMRSAIIGVACGDDYGKLKEFVRASTVITHSDPKAYYGALAVALAAHMSSKGQDVYSLDYLEALTELLAGVGAEEFLALMNTMTASVRMGEKSCDYAATTLDQAEGVSGYIYHTVPVAIHAWLSCQDNFKTSLRWVIRLGGDTDTTAAILGGIIGARIGKEGLPPALLEGLMEWPRSVRWMEKLGETLADALPTGKPAKPPTLPFPAVICRNLFFLLMVLLHGFKRFLPPY
ncbi:MAG: ADP-ribosylglycohydrolase family protein [Thermodesulfobacteriota bacterium]